MLKSTFENWRLLIKLEKKRQAMMELQRKIIARQLVENGNKKKYNVIQMWKKYIIKAKGRE